MTYLDEENLENLLEWLYFIQNNSELIARALSKYQSYEFGNKFANEEFKSRQLVEKC